MRRMKERCRKGFYSLMTGEARGPFANAMRLPLFLVCVVYHCAIRGVLFCYRAGILRAYRPQCKVISVGNITLGGTGKTPLVIAIARRLKDSGRKPAVLIRGYGAGGGAPSDEAELLKKALPDVPVLVGRDRIKTAKDAVSRYGAQVILLDDGFQHWRMDRDFDILTLGVDNPFGNGTLIPRGILREPLSSLKRADAFVLTKVAARGESVAKAQALKTRISAVNEGAATFTASYLAVSCYDMLSAGQVPLTELEGKSVALLCGIADPASFESSVESLGARISSRFYFLDHHRYDEAEIRAIIGECAGKGIDAVITTEKDAPRLVHSSQLTVQRTVNSSQFTVNRTVHSSQLTVDSSPQSTVHGSGVRFLVLAVELKIDDEERFFGRLYSLFEH